MLAPAKDRQQPCTLASAPMALVPVVQAHPGGSASLPPVRPQRSHALHPAAFEVKRCASGLPVLDQNIFLSFRLSDRTALRAVPERRTRQNIGRVVDVLHLIKTVMLVRRS